MSYIEHSRAAIDRVAQDMTVRAAHVTLRNVSQIGDRFARIVAQASAGATAEQVMKGMRAQFKGITPVAGSFISVAKSAASHTFEGIVGLVNERVVLTDENRGQFKAVAGSMYADGDENLWTLNQTASGDILVKSICGDDVALMSQLVSLSSVDYNDFETRSPLQENAEMRAVVQGGDLIEFVSPTTQAVEMGIAAAALVNADGTDTHQIHVTRRDGVGETINRELIVACAEHEIEEDPEDVASVATAANIDMNMIASYYARVFARRPEYYDMFMARFRAHSFM